MKLFHSKPMGLYHSSRQEDDEGGAEEDVLVKGTMVIGGRRRRGIQIKKQDQMGKASTTVRVPNQMIVSHR